MEDKKDTTKVTEANPQVDLMDSEPIKAAMEQTANPTAGAVVKSRSKIYTIITVILVAIALLVVLFQLERQDRIETNLFGPMIAALEANAPVATVNGEEIKAVDLESSMTQLSQAAIQQGLDTADPEVQAEVRSQAVEMMVNTTLLAQAAAANNISVADEAVQGRIDELAEASGGQEALLEQLAEFEIDEAQLRSDVQDELTIQALLETVYSDAAITVTEEEIAEVYDNATAANSDQPLPPLADVSAQIEQQIAQTREREAVEEYLQGLRADADIVIN